MVHSPKPAIVMDNNCQSDIGFALGETFRFGSLKFITDCFSSPSLSPEESANEDDMTSHGGGSKGLSIPRGCNMVIATAPVTTMPPLEGIRAPLTIPTVQLRTTIPKLDTKLPLDWLHAYHEEQQA
jgi:hypothetical protein